jgi:hypothetical protein
VRTGEEATEAPGAAKLEREERTDDAEHPARRPRDDRVVGEGHRGPITKELQGAFFAATKGEDEKHADWLTYVNA